MSWVELLRTNIADCIGRQDSIPLVVGAILIGLFAGISVSGSLPLSLIFQKRRRSPDDMLALPPKVPRHIAVIMDGNRRFGRQQHSDPLQGHWAGGRLLADFVQWCMQDGVEMATVYAFSSENWNRDPSEVNTLMSIFAKYAETMKVESLKNNVRVKVLSTDFHRLPLHVQLSIRELEDTTENCSGFLLNVCVSYGARAEIVGACKSIVKEILSKVTREGTVTTVDKENDAPYENGSSSPRRSKRISGIGSSSSSNSNPTGSRSSDNDREEVLQNFHHRNLNIARSKVTNRNANSDESDRNSNSSVVKTDRSGSSHAAAGAGAGAVVANDEVNDDDIDITITEDTISQHLTTRNIPDPDILIRTSGEYRLSNFLLWQLAYTEMFFIDKYWPQITHADLRVIFHQFHERHRRFGV